jgi:hypothetical protein
MATSRLGAARAVARGVKAAGVVGAVGAFGFFALLARATHPGGKLRGSASPPALTAPRSFVRALDNGISAGSISPASGAAAAQSGGS